MGKAHTGDLLKFLRPFDKPVIETALWLREFVWDLYPQCNELIYDNYNAVALGWSVTERLSDTFCSVAVGTNKYVHFGFYRGAVLSDPQKVLQGNGKQYRFIRVKEKKDFPAAYIKKLLKEAYANALEDAGGKNLQQGVTVVKSVSPVKKRPVKRASGKGQAVKKMNRR